MQALEEPGGDTEKFGNLAPTIVRSDTSRQTSVELVQTAGMDEVRITFCIVETKINFTICVLR